MRAQSKRVSSIRWELMLFTGLLCVGLISLVWLLNVYLLEPVYNYTIKRELENTAETYAELLEKYGTIEDGASATGINIAFMEELSKLDNDALLSGKCLDISGVDGYNLLHAHYLSGECHLHPNIPNGFGEKRDVLWNSRYVLGLRAIVLSDGDMSFPLSYNNGTQYVYCKNVDNKYVIMVSTDLDRISQASGVISSQMPFVAITVLILGLISAWIFSRWFSKPLNEISSAARDMAKGNYKTRVSVAKNDEIGILAEDFNTMAREVERSSELQRDLIANISHDLRTPLTLIKGYAETVRDLTGDNPEKRGEQLNIIVDETDRLSLLVNSVMELSKYSSGTEKLNLVEFDLAQLCDEVSYRYNDICAKNGYTLETHTDEPCIVTADPDMMSRVIHNILSNAVHHIGTDGWLSITAKPLANGVSRVEISDHGCGIASEDLPYVFDKYYRSRSDAGKVGTGLGLSITKAILVNHNFKYGVISEINKGTTFWFEAKK